MQATRSLVSFQEALSAAAPESTRPDGSKNLYIKSQDPPTPHPVVLGTLRTQSSFYLVGLNQQKANQTVPKRWVITSQRDE